MHRWWMVGISCLLSTPARAVLELGSCPSPPESALFSRRTLGALNLLAAADSAGLAEVGVGAFTAHGLSCHALCCCPAWPVVRCVWPAWWWFHPHFVLPPTHPCPSIRPHLPAMMCGDRETISLTVTTSVFECQYTEVGEKRFTVVHRKIVQ